MPKLVLMPGLDGSGDLFSDFIDALPREFDTVVIRYPGDISAYDLLAEIVLSRLREVDSYVLIAESFSSPLAIRLAGRRPKGLKAVALCGGFVTSPMRGLMRTLARVMSRMASERPIPDSLIRHYLLGSDARPELFKEVRRIVRSVSPKTLADRAAEILSCDERDALARVNLPVGYLRAGQDRVVGAWCGEEIRRIRPETKVIDVEAPHLLLQREPAKCATAIAGFLRSTGLIGS